MRVGYARVSTTEQGMEAQLERLKKDCERVFADRQSGAEVDRTALQAALEFVREGDALVATRLDRLARSVAQLCAIAETLQRKGVALVVLDQAIDTTTPTGRLLFHLLAAIAEFELSIRKEAQRAGIEYARRHGKRTGRLPKLDAKDVSDLMKAWKSGAATADLARSFRVSPRTINRYLAQYGVSGGSPTPAATTSSETA